MTECSTGSNVKPLFLWYTILNSCLWCPLGPVLCCDAPATRIYGVHGNVETFDPLLLSTNEDLCLLKKHTAKTPGGKMNKHNVWMLWGHVGCQDRGGEGGGVARSAGHTGTTTASACAGM